MLCSSGFELYSRWVPLLSVKKRNIASQLVCNNAMRQVQVACFLLPVYPYLKQDHGLEGPAARS